MKRRSLVALVLSVLMMLTLFPVYAEETAAGEVGWDHSVQDEIIVSVINGYYTAGEQKLAEEYMALHPETKVTIDVIADNNSYTTKMQTVLADLSADTASDIVHSNFLGNVVGSPAAALEQGILFDMSTILDMEHPYQDGLVRDMYDEVLIAETMSGSGGAAMQALPFDKCGISFFYNKTAFEELGLTAPETWEELLEICAVFAENGVENPITVSSEASWILASLADAGLRSREYDFLVQPGDAIWDETTMSANIDFVFDENDMTCDTLTVSSPERILMAKEDGIIFSDVSRTAWSEFAKLAQYFPENYYSGGADTVTEFEMQLSPMLISGSWNVGLILDDMNMMPEDSRFEWATFKVPGFANPPEGFQSEMRGMYVLGNIMGIIPKGDPDHDARVLDFYLYWYSQAGAQLCYEETLANGNYVQGPCMIKGVTLSDELNEKLEGFVTSGPVKQYSSEIIGMSQATQADMPLYNDLQNRFIAGEIDLDTFLEELNGIMHNYTVSQMEASGYDLDPLT